MGDIAPGSSLTFVLNKYTLVLDQWRFELVLLLYPVLDTKLSLYPPRVRQRGRMHPIPAARRKWQS